MISVHPKKLFFFITTFLYNKITRDKHILHFLHTHEPTMSAPWQAFPHPPPPATAHPPFFLTTLAPPPLSITIPAPPWSYWTKTRERSRERGSAMNQISSSRKTNREQKHTKTTYISHIYLVRTWETKEYENGLNASMADNSKANARNFNSMCMLCKP